MMHRYIHSLPSKELLKAPHSDQNTRMSFNRIGMQGSDDLFLKNRVMTDPNARLVPQNPIAKSEIRDRLSIQEQFGDDR